MTDKKYTFKKLFDDLKQIQDKDIFNFLKENWSGKEKQESLLRLFACLHLIPKINEKYYICEGNFNLKNIKKSENIKKYIFYDEKNNDRMVKDKGNISDLTCVSKNNNKHILVTTSKNKNKKTTQVGKLDIRDINSIFKDEYEKNGYTMSFCICVKDEEILDSKVKKCNKTSKDIQKYINQKDTIIIDWNHLNEAFHKFKKIYSDKEICDIISNNKIPLILRMGQEYSVLKTIQLNNSGKKDILWGHVQRSGKSYIIAGTIIEDSKNKNNCNYLVITTAINETDKQYHDVFEHYQFKDFYVKTLNSDTFDEIKKNIKNKNNNIIIVSAQYLKNTNKDSKKDNIKKIPWLKKLNFNYVFMDESHNGGTTELSNNMINYYCYNSTRIYITATYIKPLNNFSIPKDCSILWDLEDIKLCKTLQESDINRLIEKHGKIIKNTINTYNKKSIIEEYSKYPELKILTEPLDKDYVKTIINMTKNSKEGWSSYGCFELVQNIKEKNNKKIKNIECEFQDEEKILNIMYNIFGKVNKKDETYFSDEKYPDKIVYMKRIEECCKNNNSRYFKKSDKPIIILMFLPIRNIDKISDATINLLKKNNEKIRDIEKFDIIKINSLCTKTPKKDIEDAREKAIHNGKKGIIVLSGKQCSLGVSIDMCDIVILLNNINTFDTISQMMFRSMTEGKNKKYGFVIDMNIHRVANQIVTQAKLIKPNIDPQEAVLYLLKSKIITLNNDKLTPYATDGYNYLNNLSESIYNIYSSKPYEILKEEINKLCFKKVYLNENDQKYFDKNFKNTNNLSKTNKNNKKDNSKINDGLIREIHHTESKKNNLDNDQKNHSNFMNLIRHIVPLICLLTIKFRDRNLFNMYKIIKDYKNNFNNIYIYNILMSQVKKWWGKKINDDAIDRMIEIFCNDIKDDDDRKQNIRNIKDIFLKNINNTKELSKHIDNYLLPTELEKKENAEISTPIEIREEMLDKMPKNFWEIPRKIFEPCCGKGGFLIDIIDRFMNGLKKKIPDKEERHRTVVEDCLYWADINPTNIFICNLLINPTGKYNLNYHEGNTLEIDIKEKWGLDGFDAVIGNPPYEKQNATGDNKLYLEFLQYSLNILKKDKFLLFITPPNILNYLINYENQNRNYIDTFYYLKYLAINTPNKYFKNVSSKFCYFLLVNKINNNVKTTIKYLNNEKEHEFKYLLKKNTIYTYNIMNKQSISIIDKVLNNTECKFDIKNMKRLNQNYNFRIRKKQINEKKVVKEKNEEYKYMIIDKLNIHNPDGIKYYMKNKMTDYHSKKIIFSKVGYLCPYYLEDGSISDNLLYMNINSDIEYKSMNSIIRSKLFIFLKDSILFSGMDEWKILINLPKINLDKEYNNKDLYNYFKLTKKEIKLIEDNKDLYNYFKLTKKEIKLIEDNVN
jgi:hypothetical protein